MLEGEPSTTDVPIATSAGSGATPGMLVDDSTARGLTAQLFDITAERMPAAERAATAQLGLVTVGEPIEAWLEAFGIA